MSLKTKFESIVDVNAIGKAVNPFELGQLLALAEAEQVPSSVKDDKKVLLVGIDYQKDFMEGGALGVPGSIGDIERVTKFIYDNFSKITRTLLSIDTHKPQQIFHPCWWMDSNGKHPAPFTAITKKDIDDGNWIPAIGDPVVSVDYVTNLEKQGNKVLVIWPYHCIQGTTGHSLESQFMNMINFHSVARKYTYNTLVKGNSPYTEMYGVFKPEYDPKNFINIPILNSFADYDTIIFTGEAKSHCVLESIKQMLEFYENQPDVTKKVVILEDTMSTIPGFEQSTEDAFNNFKTKYGVNITTTTAFSL